MDGLGLIFLGGIGMLIVGGYALYMWAQQKRTEAWQRVAEELGIPFVGRENGILGVCSSLKIFSRGHGRRFYNAIQGDAGDTRITLGDYQFTTGSGKNRTTHVYTMCILESTSLCTPHCFLRPERAILDKLGAMLGGQDINFVDDPEFSNAYVLQGDTEFAVRELFDEEIRGWFADRRSERFHFETRSNFLVFHYGKKRQPEEASRLMQQALEIMGLIRASQERPVEYGEATTPSV
jgi:hypothetical protein